MSQPKVAVKTKRIQSIDVLRGTVMIIMALDHVRDYFHGSAFLYNPTDLSHTSVAIFFTRWITHFCAPTFFFLSGASAFMNGLKKTKKQLSVFLLTRGLWLIFLEFTVLNFAWYFDVHFTTVDFIIIWALGVSMIFLAGLIFLPLPVILLISLILIGGHNLFDGFHVPGNGSGAFIWAIVHDQRFFVFGRNLFVGYPLVPWIGVMAAGYCLGTIYTPDFDAAKRKKILISLGLGAIALFIIIRSFNSYGDHLHWTVQKNAMYTIMSFINVAKYPPSLLYILVTLGPGLLFLAFAEKPLNSVTEKVAVYGRVPLFYYIVHIYLIHILAVLAVTLSGRKWTDMVLTTWVSNTESLKGYGYSLIVVYLIWIFIIVSLYPVCKWYDKYKRTHISEKPWLSYL
ncbi:MAG: hypothetical protein C5B59_16025 [Bacteroidetes bacterium]|nr:MAG: hypothetical protein C5B59_16025 [Bacteroidota bacterium]